MTLLAFLKNESGLHISDNHSTWKVGNIGELDFAAVVSLMKIGILVIKGHWVHVTQMIMDFFDDFKMVDNEDD